jgi:tRNA G10  N-methylase Trm11
MINLSGATKGILLDPFCGIGTILQEAALMGFAVYGVDIDADAIKSCLKNLDWFENEYKIKVNKKIINGDSRNLIKYFSEGSIDAIVAEPYLGPALIEKPDENEAKKILNDIQGFYENIIKSMLKVLKPGARIVVISPSFKMDNYFMRLNIEKMLEGAKLVDPLKKYDIDHDFPFLDFEERHNTLREINIIEKIKK